MRRLLFLGLGVRQVVAQCIDSADEACLREFVATRAAVDPVPECDGAEAADGTAVSSSWCRCAASLGGAEGSGDKFVNWVGDGSCDRLFDTDACHHDDGDCSATVSTASACSS